MPLYTPEEISRFIQDAIDTIKHESGEHTIILQSGKLVTISPENWDDYLLSQEEELDDDDHLYYDDLRGLDFSSY